MDTNQMITRPEEEIEIDMKGVLIDLWRKLPLIILIGVMTAALGFVYSSFYLTPMYQSTTKMYVLTQLDETRGTTISDVQMGMLLTEDYKELITCRYVMEEVIEQLDLDMSTGQLASEITVTVPESTRILVLTVKDASPVKAKQIADAVREVASEHITNVMKIEAVNVVEEANLPTEKCGPNIKKYTMLGGVAGLFIMCAFFALRFILLDTVRTPEDIENKLGLSVLSVIPVNPNIKKKRKGFKK